MFPSDRSIPGSTVFFRDVGLYFPVKLESAGGSTSTVFASTVEKLCQHCGQYLPALDKICNNALSEFCTSPLSSVQQPWQKSFPQINRSIFANAESHLHSDPDIYSTMMRRTFCTESLEELLTLIRLNILIQVGSNT